MRSELKASHFLFDAARRHMWLILVVALLVGYWFLPIQGQLLILTDPAQDYQGAWPQLWVEPPAARPNDRVALYVRDDVPWANVKLLIDGREVERDTSYGPGNGPWTWRWHFALPEQPRYTAVFYRDCATGCIEQARVTLGDPTRQVMSATTSELEPTKLGVVFANFDRDWHAKAAWTVELTYAEQQDDVVFSIDGLAQRVQQANRNGLRVLVRIAYDRQQTLPPIDDEVALARYLDYCARLARDDRLQEVHAYIIGSGFNGLDENVLSPNQPTTPAWYARVFNGYGLAAHRSDNVVQRMRAVHPNIRVLVGPVTPWIADQDGTQPDSSMVPWLDYFNTLVALINDAVEAKSRAGIPLAAPDGFAIQAPGRPEEADEPSREPSMDRQHATWPEAQAGFRIYRDWLAIINRHAATQGRPAYIISTNTWTADTEVPPAQNYPEGWLTSALAEINREPQVQALCWFIDAAPGEMWKAFSLSQPVGRMHDAADEFDRLLQQ